MMKYTEEDLDNLINTYLDAHIECDIVPNFCRLISSDTGKERAKKKIKNLILKDGIRNIDSAIAQIESQLYYTSE